MITVFSTFLQTVFHVCIHKEKAIEPNTAVVKDSIHLHTLFLQN